MWEYLSNLLRGKVLNSIFRSLKNSSIVRNFTKLFSATILGQVITIVISPVLTRIYTPEDFGIYSLYLSITSILLVYTTGRYEYAFSTVKSEEDSINLLHLIIILSMLSSLLIGLCLMILDSLGINIFKEKEFFVTLIPLTLLVLGVFQAVNYYLNRYKDFSAISKGRIVQSISNATISIIMGISSFQNIGLIIAHMSSFFINSFYNSRRNELWKKILYVKKYDFVNIKKIAVKYKEFPLLNSTSAFFDTIALQAPSLLIPYFFSPSILGLYSLTTKIAGLPISLISMAVAQVYLSELSEKERLGINVAGIVYKAAKILALIGLVPTIILFFIGPVLFSFVFGEEWAASGEFLQLLVFSYYMKFIISPLSMLFFIKNKIKLLSYIQTTRVITTFTTLIFSAIVFDSITIFILSYVIHEIVFYLIYGSFIFKISRS